jgi:hypothetical protein
MRSAVGALLIVIAVPLLLAALFTIGVTSWVTDRGLYTAILGETRLYEIPDQADLDEWWSWPAAERLGLPPVGAAPALREIVTPQYARSQAMAILGEVFDFLDGKSAALDPALDLVPLKAALMGQAGSRFARALAAGIPEGPAGRRLVEKPGLLPSRRPMDMSVPRAAAEIHAALPAWVHTLPDRLRLGDSTQPLLRAGEWGFWQGFSALRGIVIADLVLLLAAGGFWVLSGLLGGRDPRGRLQWLGWTLFAPAFLVFGAGLAVRSAIVWKAAAFGIRAAGLESLGFSSDFTRALADVSRMVIGRMSAGYLITGAIALGISLGLLAWGWGTPRDTGSASAV